MRTALLTTLAAGVIAATASTAEAAPFKLAHSDSSSQIVPVEDERYYDLPFGVKIEKPYQDRQYDENDDHYRYDNEDPWRDSGYTSRDVKSPGWIVRNLERNDYRDISDPVLEGRSYRVWAIDPTGRDVKLLIDAESGAIERIDYT
jgi:hypothetical protein